jgi:hypothetical protein
MNILRAFVILAVVLGFSACDSDDEPASSSFSIETEVNSAKPFHFVIVIDPGSSNWIFENATGGPNTPFTDAYAENGFMVVVLTSGKQYFNLSLAKDIAIEPGTNGSTLTLRY